MYMKIPTSERKQIENEMIFRRSNELVGDGLDELDAMHIEDGNPQLVRQGDIVLEFMCECSDENCGARIPIKLSTYQTIHKDRDSFVIKLKHQVNAIEEIVTTGDEYSVVKKNNSTPEPNNILNKTLINNTHPSKQ